MPVPTSIDQLSTTAASNSPSGSDSPSVLDDHLRAQASFIARLRDAVTGAVLAGSSSAAFQAAYDAAPAGSTIVVPPGTYSGISVTGSKRVVWDVRADTSLSPSLLSLPGIVQSQQAASRMTWQGASGAADYALQRIDRTANHSGGSGVASALRVNTTVSAGVTDFEWGICSVLDNSATAGENVAIYGQGNKLTAAGPTWAGVFEARDKSGNVNPTSGLVGIEVDVFANGADSNNNRVGIDLVGGIGVGSTNAPTIYAGLRVAPQDGTKTLCTFANGILLNNAAVGNAINLNNISGNYGILMSGDVAVALDTTNLTTTTAAIRLAAGQKIALDGSNNLAISESSGRFSFAGGGLFVPSAAGNFGLDLDGSVAVGVDTTGLTASIAALRMASGQKLAFDVSSALTLCRSTTQEQFLFAGGGISISGTFSIGLDLSGFTASTAGIRLAAGQKIAFDVSSSLTLQESASQFQFSGGEVYMQRSFNIPSAYAGNITTTATAGSNGAPPAQVSGYLTFKIDGTSYKLPYYNA